LRRETITSYYLTNPKAEKVRFVIRLLNVAGSLCLLILLSPLLLLAAAAVKATSPGPVIFKQRRIGRRRKEFLIYKYRTMRADAPQDVPTHLLQDPGRHITPFGVFLRKTSLDELPQLWNILRGDMNLVGPRPALYNQDDLIALREEFGIHAIRPGLTGWAQINGRDELPIPVKVEYDRYYLEHRSLALDCRIIWRTVKQVLMSKGVVEGAGETKE
jgi:O-antigen biosynthesis protein WbqP